MRLSLLVIAVGLIFGGHNSPGRFCIVSELRADITANYLGLKEAPFHHLVRQILIPPSPSADVAANFAQAQTRTINIGTYTTASSSTHHFMFVDDNLMAEMDRLMQCSIQHSYDSCYLLFDHPQHGIFTPNLSEDKFVPEAAWGMGQLGLHVETRQIWITYPSTKRGVLLTCIDEGWGIGNHRSQRETVTLLGHTRTASTILPFGSYFCIRIQQWINTCLANLKVSL